MKWQFLSNPYTTAWWLCVVSLPWPIPFNSAALFFLVVVWAASGHWKEKWSALKNSPRAVPFYLLFAVYVLGITYSEYQQPAWLEIEKKISFLILPLIACSGEKLSPAAFTTIKNSFVYSCTAVILLTLAFNFYHLWADPALLSENFNAATSLQFHQLNQYASPVWEKFSYIELSKWMELHPAYFSMYLIWGMVIITENHAREKKLDVLSLALLLLMTVFIVLLASRMALITWAVTGTYLICNFFITGHSQVSKWSLIGAMIFFFFLMMIDPITRFRMIQEPVATKITSLPVNSNWNSISVRWLEWNASLHIIRQNLLAGVGSGDAQNTLNDQYTALGYNLKNLNYNAHNQYLQTMIETGILGLIALLFCFWLPAWKLNATYLIAFSILVSLMCLTESMLARQKGIMFFTLFQSLYLNIYRKS